MVTRVSHKFFLLKTIIQLQLLLCTEEKVYFIFIKKWACMFVVLLGWEGRSFIADSTMAQWPTDSVEEV